MNVYGIILVSGFAGFCFTAWKHRNDIQDASSAFAAFLIGTPFYGGLFFLPILWLLK